MFEALAENLRGLRRGPDPAPLYRRLPAALSLDEPQAKRVEARLSRSSNPRWSLAHFLCTYVGSPDGGMLGELVPIAPFRPERQAEPLGELLVDLGMAPRVVDQRFEDAAFHCYGRGLDAGNGEGERIWAERWAARLEDHALPSWRALRTLAEALGPQTPTWLARLLADLQGLEAMAKGLAPLAPTRDQLETCLTLVARGWSLGQPTAELGLERTAAPGWFTQSALLALAEAGPRPDFGVALETARRRGEGARLRDLLTLDVWSPAPAFNSPLDPRRNELGYALTAAAYWWFAEQPDFAAHHLEAAAALADRYGVEARSLPSHAWAGFEAIADGLLIPGDPRDDRLYWWMGQPRAHLELAEHFRTLRFGPVFRALHVGSADGSQTIFVAAALDRAIGDAPTRLEVHGVDAEWVPPIDETSLELDQNHPAYAGGWPILREELLDAGTDPGVPAAVRQIISDAAMLRTGPESLPFRRAALGRGPRYRRLPDRWQLQGDGPRSIRFSRGNLFEPDELPAQDYGLLILTHVLPWIRMYETGEVAATQARLLALAMDALRPVLSPGALIVLDPLSLLEFEGREWKLIERDPSLGVAYDYQDRQMIDLAPLSGFEVRIVEPADGLVTPAQLAWKLRS